MVNLTPEQIENGRHNYYSAVTAHDTEHNRREFFAKSVAAGGMAAAGLGAMYYNYQKPNNPVRVCVIGTGDEGNVLIGALNPDYVDVTAICDIRPSNIHRAFHGDWSSPNAKKVRPGLIKVYRYKDESEARKNIKVYSDGWEEALKDDDIQAVIIALPLHLHAPVAVAAMKAGKHVLCEKLMAHNVAQCKLMTRTAKETQSFMSIGHQRHYSILYDNAVNLIRWGLLGEIHHIRAQWHRNNRPGKDTWAVPVPGGEIGSNGERFNPIVKKLKKLQNALAKTIDSKERNRLAAQVAQWAAMDSDKTVDAIKHGYLDNPSIYNSPGRMRTALEELVRWRLWDRTGGGLMAELGSHQLDAASIFIAALNKEKGKKVHPLTVHAVGGRHLFPVDRDADDHVYCTFEFPGQGYGYDFDVGFEDKTNSYPSQNGVPSYEQDNQKKVVVTYSSINGNGYGGYGEVVMGTKATLVLDREKEALLYPLKGASYKAGVIEKENGGKVLDTTDSGDAGPAQAAQSGPVSRGYREQIEHWAWCISTGDQGNQPRCDGKVALGDAVMALTAKKAIHNSNKKGGHGFIQFQPEWFDVDSDAVPEADSLAQNTAMMSEEKKRLGLA